MRLSPSLLALSVRDYLFILFQFLEFVWYIIFQKILSQLLIFVYIRPAALRRIFKNIAKQIEYVHT